MPRLSVLVTAALAIATPAIAQQSIPTKPIVFAKGMSSTTVKGTIKGDGSVDHILNARAGQTLSVKMTTSNASSYFNLIKPSDTDVAFHIGSTEGNSFTGPVPESGNMKIRVYLMRSAARGGETADYTLAVAVTGKGADAAAHDAKVPGTAYNATSNVPCMTTPGAATGMCKAGVMRMAGGEATVELATPDGGQRRIYFKDGTPTGSDARAPLSTERRGDMNIVRIGEYEVYRIPDAFVIGG